MNHKQLVKAVKPGLQILIKGVPYTVKQHIVWMQHRADYTYDKWVLVDSAGYDGYRFFIETNENAIGFAIIFHYDFNEPIPEELKYDGKIYKQTCGEFCTAVRVEGDEVYKEGDGEIWWDYSCTTDPKEGLSLGRSWET
ncbi:hypothetical protein A3H26_04105 [candidate division WWE3 bacterium RIFCSPLOWO2_12_FULL_36_10]|uniref:DUF4178 domain-containing protein n=1 Tax=candidate division WWE3 bacterium RIFCSPLOWO2_12_FULL_36_10 TaxID=1802630 RepID=A0A1F4VI02_UNCKA|nr:MAG: hypothetical protein A3H26_04105 [candidate division WWE3 bacterium RIFCSPLOWO2_12_FULL_36_10]